MSLSPKKIRAAELLSKGHSHDAVGDAVGVSRRTILRWLKQEDFKNLSYGLVGRAVQSPQPAQRERERRQQRLLTPQDLIQDALSAVQSILVDPEVRVCDRLKAAALVGQWAGLEVEKNKMAEMQAVQVLIESNWVPSEVLDTLIDGSAEMEERVRNAFLGCFHDGNKKSLPQENPRKGTADEFDDDFDDDL
jgi:hypothetical protein